MGKRKPLFVFVLIFSFCSFFSSTFADDSAIMKKIASSFSPTPSSWSGTDPCKWYGVNCDGSGQVTSIDLSSKSVSGTLAPEINQLSQLKTLSLQQNHISGSLPSFSNLTHLQELFLDSNNFTSVPSSTFVGLSSLQTLSISNNPNLDPWFFPLDLKDSSSLVTLSISNANLMGSIPDFFDSFPSMESLRLSYNNLTGPLPPSLAGSEIRNLWLNNQVSGLSGRIDVIGTMNQLLQVWLHKNAFSGPIPDLVNCTLVFDLQLRDNQLTGVLPTSIFSLPQLVNVSLANNKLQGPYPEFGKQVTNVTIGTTNSFCNSKPGPCDPQVMTLLEVAGALGYPMTLAESWNGNDACQQWSFINCDSQGKNVTGINFAKQHFTGTISPMISNLASLRNLFLNENNLSGPIPDSLTSLSQLQVLDVSNNNLSGKIPQFPSRVTVKTSGNTLLGANSSDEGGGESPPSGSGSSTTSPSGSQSGGHARTSISAGLIAGTVIGVLVFITVVFIVSYKCYTKKSQQKFGRFPNDPRKGKEIVKNGIVGTMDGYGGVASELHSQSSGDNSDAQFFEGGKIAISIQVLRQVTDNFSEKNILGRGGFGVVYKGELHDGTHIAVKRMESNVMGTKGLSEFQAEIAVLTKVRHRHLVALLGYCVNGNERLLVYEYMPRGTLGQHLFDWSENGNSPLSWKQRVSIALDVARGVEYLHSLAQQSFIHRDLKPSNILLGDDMRAKVADFGLVKNAPDGKYSVETRLAGTFGYLAPEYAATGRVTTKVDVYAFGVVLMELITGRKTLDETVPEERSHLVTWFRRVLINKENIRKAIDPTLNPDDETFGNICKVAELAGHCTAREPLQRPDMGHAVNILGPLVQQWKPTCSTDEDGFESTPMSLPQVLQRWQADESTSTTVDDLQYGPMTSLGNTQSSIPTKPTGFDDTFDSGR